MKKTGRGTAGGPSREKNSIRPGKKTFRRNRNFFVRKIFRIPAAAMNTLGEDKKEMKRGCL